MIKSWEKLNDLYDWLLHSNDNFFKQIEKIQASFSKEDNKIWTDVNKEYKKLKNKKSKTEQHEK